MEDLKENYGISEEEMEALIEGFLLGEFTLPPDAPDWILDILTLS